MKQNILVIGAFDYIYIRDNWLEPIQHLLSGQCMALDINVMLACMTRAEVECYILEHVRSQRITHIMFYHDVIFSDFCDLFFLELKSINVCVVTFYADDEPPFWYGRNVKLDHHYSLIGTHSLKGIALRKLEAPLVSCYYMPWGVNERLIVEPEKAEFDYDVIFIGRNKDVLGCGLHREDGAIRDLQLQRIADNATINNWRFAIFGFGWENHPVLSSYYAGTVPEGLFFKTLMRSRIVFNPAYAWDGVTLSSQVKLRHFEVAANGLSLQLTNTNDELSSLLNADQEVVFYQDTDDLIDKIALWLNQPLRCVHVAAQARERTLKEHTIDNRLNGLMTAAGIHISSSVNRVDKNIAKITHSENMSDLYISAINSTADYLYFCASDIDVTLDYTLINHALLSNPDVLSAHCLISGYASLRDPVQPRREEIFACRMCGNEPIGRVLPYFKNFLGQINHHNVSWWWGGSLIRKDLFLHYLIKSRTLVDFLGLLSQHPHITCSQSIISFLRIDARLQKDSSLSPVQRGLHDVVNYCVARNRKLAIYGARGDLAESTLHYLNTYFPSIVYRVVDNGSVGKSIAGQMVLSHQDLVIVEQAIVLVCAAYSGPAIIQQCHDLSSSVHVIPLYDLFDDAWNYLYE